jgi:hypothetical protein
MVVILAQDWRQTPSPCYSCKVFISFGLGWYLYRKVFHQKGLGKGAENKRVLGILLGCFF